MLTNVHGPTKKEAEVSSSVWSIQLQFDDSEGRFAEEKNTARMKSLSIFFSNDPKRAPCVGRGATSVHSDDPLLRTRQVHR